MTLRINAGLLKGMAVQPPKTEETRPTALKVRQAVMNSLAPYLVDRLVLDLCAGTGAIGLEAVSRGARGAVFVEMGRQVLPALKANVEAARTRCQKQGAAVSVLELVPSSVEQAGKRLRAWAPFDVIWFDPPYAQTLTLTRRILPDISALAAADGMMVIESAVDDQAPLISLMTEHQWDLTKEKAYRQTAISIFSRQAKDNADEE